MADVLAADAADKSLMVKVEVASQTAAGIADAKVLATIKLELAFIFKVPARLKVPALEAVPPTKILPERMVPETLIALEAACVNLLPEPPSKSKVPSMVQVPRTLRLRPPAVPLVALVTNSNFDPKAMLKTVGVVAKSATFVADIKRTVALLLTVKVPKSVGAAVKTTAAFWEKTTSANVVPFGMSTPAAPPAVVDQLLTSVQLLGAALLAEPIQ